MRETHMKEEEEEEDAPSDLEGALRRAIGKAWASGTIFFLQLLVHKRVSPIKILQYFVNLGLLSHSWIVLCVEGPETFCWSELAPRKSDDIPVDAKLLKALYGSASVWVADSSLLTVASVQLLIRRVLANFKVLVSFGQRLVHRYIEKV